MREHPTQRNEESDQDSRTSCTKLFDLVLIFFKSIKQKDMSIEEVNKIQNELPGTDPEQ